MPDLEEKLVQDIAERKETDLLRALLVVSGLTAKSDFERYEGRLAKIHAGYVAKLKRKNPVSFPSGGNYKERIRPKERARTLFEHLWHTKPRRVDSNILLTHVIDAQLSPDTRARVGTCVGLTCLYTVLGLMEGLELTVLASGEHILSRLRAHDIAYDIEHTDQQGFGCDLEGKTFTELPAINLVAHVFNSRGMAKERAGNIDAALEDYGKALIVRPDYSNAYNNRGNMRFRRGDFIGACQDYDRAIGFDPLFVEAYVNRGQAKERLGHLDAAIEDFEEALKIEPECGDAKEWLGVLKGREGGL